MKKLKLLLLSLGFCASLSAQTALPDYEATFQALEKRLKRGDVQALRDLGSLLEEEKVVAVSWGKHRLRERVGSIARRLLQSYLFLLKRDSLLEQGKRQAFLQFYDHQQANLIFDPWVDGFLDDSLQNYPLEYQIAQRSNDPATSSAELLRQMKQNFKEDIEKRYYLHLPSLIEQMGATRQTSAVRLLWDCLRGKYDTRQAGFPRKAIRRAALLALRHFPEPATLTQIIAFLKENPSDIEIQTALVPLSLISNHYPQHEIYNLSGLADYYQQIFGQYLSLDKMHQAGYYQSFDYRANFFSRPVDYYGKMLLDADRLYWIKQNALADLVKYHDPKLLLYLAARIFQNRRDAHHFGNQDLQLLAHIRKRTGVDIWIKDAKGTWTNDPEADLTSQFHYLLYWQQHYQDYHWDDEKQVFINRVEAPQTPRAYEHLWQQLYARSEDEAERAFIKLSEINEASLSDPSRENIVQIRGNYRLPSFPFLTLSVLQKFTQLCRVRDKDYHLRAALEDDLRMLEEKLSTRARYQQENRIIEQLQWTDITALEYQAILRQNHYWAFNSSVGRIIRCGYARFLPEVLSDTAALNFYLKKTALFRRLKGKGLSQQYTDFLKNLRTQQIAILETTHTNTQDTEVKQILAEVLHHPRIPLESALQSFLEHPSALDLPQVQAIHIAHPQDYQEIVQRIGQWQDAEPVRLLLSYLESQAKLEAVPSLIALLNDHRVIDQIPVGNQFWHQTVADRAVLILEKIYKHSFADEKDFYLRKPVDRYIFKKTHAAWKSLWQQRGANYQEWEQMFLEQKLAELSSPSALKINLINNICASPYYKQSQHQAKVIRALARVSPSQDLAYFYPDHDLALRDFQQIRPHLSGREAWVNMLSWMALDTNQVWPILEEIYIKGKGLDAYQRGKWFYALWQRTELSTWLDQAEHAPLAEMMLPALRTYLQDFNALDDEYYHLKKAIFWVGNYRETLEEKIRIARHLKDEDSKTEAFEAILLSAGYEDLPVILRFREAFATAKQPERFQTYFWSHLREDLGIPVEKEGESAAMQILSRYKTLSALAFYKSYLSDFDSEILDSSGEVSQEKALELLRGGIAEDFISLMPARRAQVVYTLIAYLELKFQTRLGFPQNLRHRESFLYRKAEIGARVDAWIAYLEKQSTQRALENK